MVKKDKKKHGKGCLCEICKADELKIENVISNSDDYTYQIEKRKTKGIFWKHTVYIIIAMHKKTKKIEAYTLKKIFI